MKVYFVTTIKGREGKAFGLQGMPSTPINIGNVVVDGNNSAKRWRITDFEKVESGCFGFATPPEEQHFNLMLVQCDGVTDWPATYDELKLETKKYLTDEYMLKAVEWASNFDGDLPLTGRPLKKN